MHDLLFHHLVQQALDLIPSEFRPYLENVVVIVEEAPDKATRRRLGLEDDETLYGLYVGTPLTERTSGEPLLPDRILIYRRPQSPARPQPGSSECMDWRFIPTVGSQAGVNNSDCRSNSK